MEVTKWGDSLGVKIPASVVSGLGLREGDEVDVQITRRRATQGGRIGESDEVFAALRKFRGRRPKEFRFNREEANERR